jgi:hypothetical protein
MFVDITRGWILKHRFSMLDNVKQMQRVSFLLMVLVIILFLLVAIVYSLKYTLQIKYINIENHSINIDDNLIRSTIKNDISGNFLTINLSKLKRDIKHISWVKNVFIERKFPDTINIKIDGYVPYALLNNNHTILTENKEIINNTYLSGIPFFNVPENKIDEIILLYKSANNFAKLKFLKVTSVLYDGFNVVSYKFDNNMNLTSCNAIKIDEDFAKLNQYWDSIIAIESIPLSINMCYQNAIAILN